MAELTGGKAELQHQLNDSLAHLNKNFEDRPKNPVKYQPAGRAALALADSVAENWMADLRDWYLSQIPTGQAAVSVHRSAPTESEDAGPAPSGQPKAVTLFPDNSSTRATLLQHVQHMTSHLADQPRNIVDDAAHTLLVACATCGTDWHFVGPHEEDVRNALAYLMANNFHALQALIGALTPLCATPESAILPFFDQSQRALVRSWLQSSATASEVLPPGLCHWNRRRCDLYHIQRHAAQCDLRPQLHSHAQGGGRLG